MFKKIFLLLGFKKRKPQPSHLKTLETLQKYGTLRQQLWNINIRYSIYISTTYTEMIFCGDNTEFYMQKIEEIREQKKFLNTLILPLISDEKLN